MSNDATSACFCKHELCGTVPICFFIAGSTNCTRCSDQISPPPFGMAVLPVSSFCKPSTSSHVETRSIAPDFLPHALHAPPRSAIARGLPTTQCILLPTQQHAKITRNTDGAQSPRHTSPGRACGRVGTDAATSTSTSPRLTAGATGSRRGLGDSDKGAVRSPAERPGRAAGGGAGEACARVRGRAGQAPPRGAGEEDRVRAEFFL